MKPTVHAEDKCVLVAERSQADYVGVMLCVGHHLVTDIDVNIFTEGIALRETCCTVFHQIKGLQRAKRCQQFLDLWNREKSLCKTLQIYKHTHHSKSHALN